MIERTTAIPLAIYPYSNRSHIVHWLTRHHGLISTLLKAAQHPRSPFIGEYQLFGTTELLYYNRHKEVSTPQKNAPYSNPENPTAKTGVPCKPPPISPLFFVKYYPKMHPLPSSSTNSNSSSITPSTFTLTPSTFLGANSSSVNTKEIPLNSTTAVGAKTTTSNSLTLRKAPHSAANAPTHHPLPSQPLPPKLQALIQTLLQTEIPHNLPTEVNHTPLLPALNHLTGTFMSVIYQLSTIHRNALAA